MDKEPNAIDCWIDGCPWWENEPPGTLISKIERQDVRVAHMWSQHSAREMSAEVERRIAAMAADCTLTLQQRQERAAIIGVLRVAIMAVEEHPLPDDPV